MSAPPIDQASREPTGLELVGAGQAAWALGQALHAQGIPILRVIARPQSGGPALAQRLEAEWIPWDPSERRLSKLEHQPSTPGITLFAVSDDAILKVASAMDPERSLGWVHCSGTVSLETLAPHPVRGVFWPLLNLSRAEENAWQGASILVQSSEPKLRDTLVEWSQRLQASARIVSEEQRQKLHLAAVMTANFNNVLLHWGHRLTRDLEGHQDLIPILLQQLRYFEQSNTDPLNRQSGPAWRNDLKTMDLHQKLLQDDPEGTALYRWFSSLIRRLRQNNHQDRKG